MNANAHIHDVGADLPRIIGRFSVIRGVKGLSGVDDIFCVCKCIPVEMIQAEALQALNHALNVETPNV